MGALRARQLAVARAAASLRRPPSTTPRIVRLRGLRAWSERNAGTVRTGLRARRLAERLSLVRGGSFRQLQLVGEGFAGKQVFRLPAASADDPVARSHRTVRGGPSDLDDE
jgi:hypothetical protein